MKRNRIFLIVAGGTGGHIFPALSVAEEMSCRGYQIIWIGSENSMEAKIVARHQYIAMHFIRFKGVRGKGSLPWITLPFTLLRACMDSLRILKSISPDVVLVMGGYLSLPVGLASFFMKVPLILHEQNSYAGLANRVLSFFAQRVLTVFPKTLRRAESVGMPISKFFLSVPEPGMRYSGRTSQPLNILVVGGSLGASFLNELMPKALSLLLAQNRPVVLHQTGEKHLLSTRMHYMEADANLLAGGKVELVSFIEDMAKAYSEADLLICRSGAMTIAEVSAVGVAVLFVPYPLAVDDHQTSNAEYLVKVGAADLFKQSELTPEKLAIYLRSLTRLSLSKKAICSKKLAKYDAAKKVADVCIATAELRKN